MSTDTLERLPNTVTKCHDEIKRLRAAVVDPDGEAEQISALESERDELKDTVAELEAEKTALELRVKELEDAEKPDAIEAIDAFLNECERIGPLKYDVPQSDRTFRAIIGLHDAAGRTP
jgi:predicted nuclease with TOPRIM domain